MPLVLAPYAHQNRGTVVAQKSSNTARQGSWRCALARSILGVGDLFWVTFKAIESTLSLFGFLFGHYDEVVTCYALVAGEQRWGLARPNSGTAGSRVHERLNVPSHHWRLKVQCWVAQVESDCGRAYVNCQGFIDRVPVQPQDISQYI